MDKVYRIALIYSMPEVYLYTLNRSDCYLAMNKIIARRVSHYHTCILLFKALLQMSLIRLKVQYLHYAALIFVSLMNIVSLLSVGFDPS